MLTVFMAILFSCTFALAAEGYTVPHPQHVLIEEQNESKKRLHRLQYFTQGVLYNFIHGKVNPFFFTLLL